MRTRRDVKADHQKQILELLKRLEEREAIQEQSEAILRGRVEELEKDLKQQIIYREQGEARLRGHITDLEKELKERDEGLCTDAEGIVELKKNLQLEATRREESERVNDVLNGLRKELAEKDRVIRELQATIQLQDTNTDKEETISHLRDEVQFHKEMLVKRDMVYERKEALLKFNVNMLKNKLKERNKNVREFEATLHRRCQDVRVQRERVIRINKELVRLKETNKNNKKVVAALKVLSDTLQDANYEKTDVESALLGKMKNPVSVVFAMAVLLLLVAFFLNKLVT
jgi:hypothetical protein